MELPATPEMASISEDGLAVSQRSEGKPAPSHGLFEGPGVDAVAARRTINASASAPNILVRRPSPEILKLIDEYAPKQSFEQESVVDQLKSEVK